MVIIIKVVTEADSYTPVSIVAAIWEAKRISMCDTGSLLVVSFIYML